MSGMFGKIIGRSRNGSEAKPSESQSARPISTAMRQSILSVSSKEEGPHANFIYYLPNDNEKLSIEPKKLNLFHKAVYDNDMKKLSKLMGEKSRETDKVDATYNITALYLATMMNNVQMVNALLPDSPKKANTNLQCAPMSRTPLIMAVINDNLEMTNILLSHGADPNIKDSLGCSALTYTLHNKSTDILKSLLENYPGLSFNDKSGMGVVHHAARMGKIDHLTLLIRAGGSIEYKDEEYRTCMHHAVINRQVAAVKKLIELNADTNAIDCKKSSPLDYARSAGFNELIEILSPTTKQETQIEPSKDSRAVSTIPTLSEMESDSDIGATPVGNNALSKHSTEYLELIERYEFEILNLIEQVEQDQKIREDQTVQYNQALEDLNALDENLGQIKTIHEETVEKMKILQEEKDQLVGKLKRSNGEGKGTDIENQEIESKEKLIRELEQKLLENTLLLERKVMGVKEGLNNSGSNLNLENIQISIKNQLSQKQEQIKTLEFLMKQKDELISELQLDSNPNGEFNGVILTLEKAIKDKDHVIETLRGEARQMQAQVAGIRDLKLSIKQKDGMIESLTLENERLAEFEDAVKSKNKEIEMLKTESKILKQLTVVTKEVEKPDQELNSITTLKEEQIQSKVDPNYKEKTIAALKFDKETFLKQAERVIDLEQLLKDSQQKLKSVEIENSTMKEDVANIHKKLKEFTKVQVDSAVVVSPKRVSMSTKNSTDTEVIETIMNAVNNATKSMTRFTQMYSEITVNSVAIQDIHSSYADYSDFLKNDLSSISDNLFTLKNLKSVGDSSTIPKQITDLKNMYEDKMKMVEDSLHRKEKAISRFEKEIEEMKASSKNVVNQDEMNTKLRADFKAKEDLVKQYEAEIEESRSKIVGIEAKEKENKALDAKVKSLETKVQELTSKQQETKQQETASFNSIGKGQQSESSKQEIEKKNKIIEAYEQEISELKDKITSLREKRTKETEVANTNEQDVLKRNELKKLANKNEEALNEQKASFLSEIAKLEETIQSMNDKHLEAMTSQRRSFDYHIQEHEKHIQERDTEISGLKTKVEHLKQDIVNVNESLARLNTEYEEYQTNTNNSRVVKESDKMILLNKIAALESTRQDLEEANNQFKSKVKDLNNTIDSYKEFEFKYELSENNGSLQKTNLTNQLKQKDATIDQKDEEIMTLKKKLSKIIEENHERDFAIISFENDIQKLRSRMNSTTETTEFEKKELKSKISVVEDNFMKILKEKDADQRRRLDMLNEELSASNRRCHDLDKECHRIRSEFNETRQVLESDKIVFHSKLSNAELVRKKVEGENDLLQAKIYELGLEVQRYRDFEHKYEISVQTIAENKNNFEIILRNREKLAAELEEDIENLNRKLAKLNEENKATDNILFESRVELKELRQDVVVAETEKKELRIKIENLLEIQKALESDNSTLKMKLNQAWVKVEEANEIQTKYEANQDLVNQQRRKIDHQNQDTQQFIEEKEHELHSIKKKLVSTQNDLELENDSLKKKLRAEHDNLEELRDYKAKYEELKTGLLVATQSHEGVDNLHVQIQTIVAQKERTVIMLKQELDIITEEKNMFTKTINELQNERMLLEKKLMNIQQEYEMLEDSHKHQMIKLNREVDLSADQYDLLKRENAKLYDEKNDCLSRLEEVENDLTSITEKTEKLMDKMREKDDQIKVMQADHEKMDYMKHECERLKSELVVNKNSNEKVHLLDSHLTIANEQLNSALQKLSDITDIHDNLQVECEQLSEVVRRKTQRILTLEVELTSNREQVLATKHFEELLKHHHDEICNQLQKYGINLSSQHSHSLETYIKAQQEALKTMEDMLATIQKEYKEQVAHYNKLQQSAAQKQEQSTYQINLLEHEVNSVRTAAAEYKQKSQYLEEKVEEAHRVYLELKNESVSMQTHLQSQVNLLTTKLATTKSEATKLQHRLTTTIQIKNDMEQDMERAYEQHVHKILKRYEAQNQSRLLLDDAKKKSTHALCETYEEHIKALSRELSSLRTDAIKSKVDHFSKRI